MAGEMNGAPEKQQLFRQRGLARIGMGDDGESSPGFGCRRSGRRGQITLNGTQDELPFEITATAPAIRCLHPLGLQARQTL
jgi:hypothetical protein